MLTTYRVLRHPPSRKHIWLRSLRTSGKMARAATTTSGRHEPEGATFGGHNGGPGKGQSGISFSERPRNHVSCLPTRRVAYDSGAAVEVARVVWLRTTHGRWGGVLLEASGIPVWTGGRGQRDHGLAISLQL